MANETAVSLDVEFFRMLNRVVEPMVRAGLGSPRFVPGGPIAVAARRALGDCLVVTGFLPDKEIRARQTRVPHHVLPRVRGIRCSGCPALDPCVVASGRADACFECGLGSWDIAAGAAIVETAGGFVSTEDVPGLPPPLLVAASGERLASELSAIVREAARELGA